jgi:hypothetical protein
MEGYGETEVVSKLHKLRFVGDEEMLFLYILQRREGKDIRAQERCFLENIQIYPSQILFKGTFYICSILV